MTGSGSNLLTVLEVADLLRVEPQTVRNWIDRGALPAVTLPHLPDPERLEYRIHRDWLRAARGGEPLPDDFFEVED